MERKVEKEIVQFVAQNIIVQMTVLFQKSLETKEKEKVTTQLQTVTMAKMEVEKETGNHGEKEKEKEKAAEKATAKENSDDDHDGTGAEKVDLPMPMPTNMMTMLMDTPTAVVVTMAGLLMAAITLVGHQSRRFLHQNFLQPVTARQQRRHTQRSHPLKGSADSCIGMVLRRCQLFLK